MDIRERIRKRATGEIDNEAELKKYEKKLIEQQKQEKEEIEERKRIQRAERVNRIKRMSEESNVLPKATRQDVIEHSKKYDRETNNEVNREITRKTAAIPIAKFTGGITELPKGTKEYKSGLNDVGIIGSNLLKSAQSGLLQFGKTLNMRTDETLNNYNELSNSLDMKLIEMLEKKGKTEQAENVKESMAFRMPNLDSTQEYQEKINKLNQEMALNTATASNKVTQKIAGLSQSIGNNLVGMAATALNPALGATYFTGSAYGSYYDEGIERGMDEQQAKRYAAPMAIFEGLTEKALAGENIKSFKAILEGTGFKNTLKAFGIEVGENFVQEAVMPTLSELTTKTLVGDKFLKNDYRTAEGWLNLAKDSISDGIDGILSAILLNGSTKMVGSCINVVNKLEQGQKVTPQEIQTAVREAQNAGVDVQGILQNEVVKVAEKKVVQSTQKEGETINKTQTNRTNAEQINNDTLPIKEESKRYSNRIYEESAKKYGIDTNNETVKSINRVAQERGITVKFDSEMFENNSTNAIWRNNADGTREIILNPNADTKRTLQSVITHELTHDFEGTVEYNELKELVLNYDKGNVDFENARKSLEDIYSRVYDKNSNEFQTLVENEAVADILGNKLGDQNFINSLTTEKPSTARKIYNWVIDKLNKVNKLTGYRSEKIFWADVKNKFENAYKQDYKGNNTIKYHVSENFNNEIDKTLNNELASNTQVKARDYTPSILVNNGVKDLPMLMTQKHIKSIIYTLQEAQNLGLPTKNINYHGLGKDLLIKAIDNLDTPEAIYKTGTDNYLVVTEFKDNNGKEIVVPIQINGKGRYNDVFIDENQIKSVYGRNNLNKYLQNNNFEKVYVKNKESDFNEGIQYSNVADSSINNSITPTNEDVNTTKHSMQKSENNTWQEYLDQNYKSTGMGQTIQDVKVAPPVENNTLPMEEYTTPKNKTLNPTEIANLKQDDANTTPKLKNKKYAKGNKQSSFFSNITEDSEFLNKDLREEMSKEENIQYYKGITNTETLEKAYNKLQENGQNEVIKWHSKKSEDATAEDVAEGWILLKQYQDNGEYKNAVEVAKKMRDIGTTAGQTVQAYNILSRLTPEGMFLYAQKELSEAYEKMVEGKSKKWIEENRTKFDLTPEDTQFIKETMQEVSKMEDGYDKKVKLAQIQKVITDKIPSNAGKSLKAWMRISMLFNPKTQVRNIAGNAIIAPVNMFSDSVSAGIDRIISKRTGVRTTGNTNLIKYAKGFGKGLYESYNDFRNGINTRNVEGNRFEITEGKSFNDKGIGKALNRVDNLLSFMLDAGDRSFYEATFTNSINNQLVLNNKKEVTQDMIDIATTEALQRTWQDNNAYTQVVLSIRNNLNGKVGKRKGLEYGLGDILIPFAKTPANLTKAIVDYSPIGLTKSLVLDARKLKNSLSNGQYSPQLQHKTVQNIGKGFAGTFLYVAAYALAKAGIASGEADEDKDVKNFIKNALGINNYSIKIGDKSFTYDWAQPIAAPLSIMTNIVNSDKKDIALLEAIVSNLDSAGSILLEQSFLESINSVLNNTEGFVTGLINEVLELPSRALPTLSKQIADLVDGTQRTTYEYGNPLKSATNTVINKIPGASKTLPAARDTLGNEIKKYGGDNSVWNVMFNPSNANSEKISNAGKEIYQVYMQTGDTTIFPRTAPYYINNNGEKIIMTSSQRSEFQKVSGQYVEKTLNALMNDSTYKKLKDTEKSKIINEIVSDSYAKAKYDVLKIESEQYKEKRELLKQVSTKTYYNYQIKTDGLKKTNEKIKVLVDAIYTDKEKTILYENYIKSEDDKKYDIIKSTGLNINSYLKYKLAESNGEFDSDKEDDGTVKGKTITNSAKNKRYNYINSTNATYTQKLILWALEYEPSSNSEKQLVINYINSMPNKTQEEKLEMMSKFKGVTIYKNGTFDY